MSFQADLDSIEKKTGLTPRRLVDQAHARGYDATTKAGPVLAGSPRSTAWAAGPGWRSCT
jgi:hypothetical protein